MINIKDNKQFKQKLIEWQVTQEQVYIKYWRNSKEQPRMDNPQTPATLGTQDTGRIQTKHNQTKPKQNKTKNKTKTKQKQRTNKNKKEKKRKLNTAQLKR